MKLFPRLLAILSSGYILFFFSEQFFWARVRPEDTVGNWLMTWLVYSVMAYVMLATIQRFHVRNGWALFLTGALVGWLAEGLIVQTAYESLPLSLSFTGLAWHAILSVWIGWYGLQKLIRSNQYGKTALISALIGVGWGFWSISWWLEEGEVVTPWGEYATFVLLSSLLLIASYALYTWVSTAPFVPQRRGLLAAALFFAFWFLFNTLPTTPIATLILPLLLLSLYLPLRRHRAEGEGSFVETLVGRGRVLSYLCLLPLPLMAILVYGLALWVNLRLHSNWIVYLICTPLGFILWGLAIFRLWRQPSVAVLSA